MSFLLAAIISLVPSPNLPVSTRASSRHGTSSSPSALSSTPSKGSGLASPASGAPQTCLAWRFAHWKSQNSRQWPFIFPARAWSLVRTSLMNQVFLSELLSSANNLAYNNKSRDPNWTASSCCFSRDAARHVTRPPSIGNNIWVEMWSETKRYVLPNCCWSLALFGAHSSFKCLLQTWKKVKQFLLSKQN